MNLLDTSNYLKCEIQNEKWVPKYNGLEVYPSKSFTKMHHWSFDNKLKKEIFGFKRFFLFFFNLMWEYKIQYPKNENELENSLQICGIMCNILNKEEQIKIKLEKYYNDINT